MSALFVYTPGREAHLESVLIYASGYERSRWAANRPLRQQVVPLRVSSSADVRLIDPHSHFPTQNQNRLLVFEVKPAIPVLGEIDFAFLSFEGLVLPVPVEVGKASLREIA